MLAGLLLEPGSVVPIDRLVDVVWGETPPASARVQVQNRVATLRGLLRADGCGDVIATQGSGYVIPADRATVDVEVFESQVADAERHVQLGRHAAAADQLTDALALWRGPALDGLTSPTLAAAASRLDERRTSVRIRRLELAVKAGRAGTVLGELAELVAEHPWHEQLVGQLMTALYLANRQRDALLCYDRLRRGLADELGVDPGPELASLHDRILHNDPSLQVDHRAPVAPAPQAAGDPGLATVPRQLPGDVPTFAGRSAQLRQLDELLPAGSAGTPAATISAIEGPAGVGKSALALHWAHRVADKFADGQLYVNLRGFDSGGSAMSPAEAVRGFLEALDVPAPRIPLGFEAQIGLYRSLLASRRVLVVLDNARDVDQVRPLLPGSAGCRAIVTSRNRLSSLLAKEGARPLVLDVLSAAEAHQLLAGRVGGDRMAAEPRAADGIVARCARLPLALVVVAARAATHPGFPLASLAAELRDAQGDLDVFDDGSADTSVRAVFLWSYQALGPDAGRLFRLLGLHPGPDVTAEAAASLAGIPLKQAQRLLSELARAHMIVESTPRRFAFHDLLRSYAAELAGSADTEAERGDATRRMLDHYLHTARTAALLLNPQRNPIALAVPHPDVTPEAVADATAWFTAEQPVLLAAVRRAADTGFAAHAWQLAWATADFLDRGGHWHELADAQRIALAAASRSADLSGQARAHDGIARACSRLGDHEEAHAHLELALDLHRALGDRVSQAYTHRGLAATLEWQGNNAEALGHDQQALTLYREAGHLPGQASALNSIGWCHAQIGDYARALDCCQQALALHRSAGNRHGQASTLDSLGYVHHRIGDPARAATCYEQALELFRELGDRYYEADTLTHLGDAWQAAGDEEVARQAWRDALRLLTELQHPDAATVRSRLQSARAEPAPAVLPRQRVHLTGTV